MDFKDFLHQAVYQLGDHDHTARRFRRTPEWDLLRVKIRRSCSAEISLIPWSFVNGATSFDSLVRTSGTTVVRMKLARLIPDGLTVLLLHLKVPALWHLRITLTGKHRRETESANYILAGEVWIPPDNNMALTVRRVPSITGVPA